MDKRAKRIANEIFFNGLKMAVVCLIASLVIFAVFRDVYAAGLPRLLDLGASGCLPCRLMKPILRELKQEYEGSLEVEVIDVWENPAMGKKYNVRAVPTQIFFDASGKELYRHMGFMSKKDILKTFERLGINLKKAPEKKKR